MTQVRFLHGVGDRLQAAAAWLAIAAAEGRPVLVFVPHTGRAEQLDRLLWTQPATGFIAHCRADDPLAGETSIVLANSLEKAAHDGCLLNLGDEIPPGFSRFHELVEIISIDEEDRLQGRERFRYYRERGYPLDARDVSTGIA